MTKGRDHLAERRAELERRLAALTPEQRAQLERARGEAPTVVRPAGINPREPGTPVPMSYAQELLWLLDRANPGMHGYNVPRTARLRGALDVAALRRALSEIVARHEVLRSTFAMVDGELRQIVHPPAPVRLNEIDLSGREADAVAKVRELTRRPFDLTKDSQLRSTLIRLADDDHVLLLESHHVASDAWSRNILLRELSALYDAYRTGADAGLRPVTVQYGDFAIWQRETLRGPRLERLLDYWREQLNGAPSVLELPTDRPRPITPSFEGDARSRMLPSSLLDRLRDLSRANDSTLFMTLLAAFDVLLARYSGQTDIVVGSPIAGRAHEGTEGVIGYFANTLVLRTQLDDDPTFLDLLARVREGALGAFEHQDVPYEKLVLEIQRERAMGAGSAPLFQTMFTLQDAELRAMQLPGLAIEPFGSARGATKFDLSLFMHEQSGGLRAAFEFRTDLFDASTLERMLAQLEVLLEAIVAAPNTRVSSLPLLPADERATLERWSSGGTQPLEAETLHEQIAMQAARTPDAIAVESEGASPSDPLRQLTFRELDQRAATVARYLVGMGVGPDVGVGICIERSPELVVAMLGVLKAGGYYLPLDPEYPPDRLAFMLEDARVPVVLSESRSLAALGTTIETCSVVALDTEWDSVIAAAHGNGARPRKTVGSDLAYVIYTSGSTGRPKGVMIPHTAVVNYLTWMRSEFPLDTRDAVLQKAPASFDACIWEFFLPLVSGARLVLARPGGHQDPAYLLDALTKHDITLLQLVPSQLQMMLETPGADGPRGLPRLRRLFLGGEALPSELLTRLAAVCPTLPVTNLYGPTEATVYASHWSVDLRNWHGGAVPIGRPITGATIHLVDSLLQTVPIGVPGELCIGGVGLARGYLNRAELTAEKFIFGTPDSRSPTLYRTGDRARYRADGTLEYLGRIDTQVKLRGFRVELGEIENALVHVEDVQSAVVLVREDTPGDQRLVAYLLATPGSDHSQHTPASLRQQLKTSLPDFMVPTAFVWLSEWPMNANGKLDRKALPLPQESDTAIAERVAPRTPTEHALAAIWQEILHREVGVEDDFFELGGHSLLALRTLARIADQLGPRIPLRALFDAPTIALLAARVDAAGGSPLARNAPIARLSGNSAPMSYAQELLWLLQQTSPELSAYNVAEQWKVSGPLDIRALGRALTALVQRHEVFRTTFAAKEGVPTQTIGGATDVPLEVIELPGADEGEVASVVRELARVSFDLSRDQLLRATLVRTAPEEHVFVLVTHHIVCDGWSRSIIQRDLSALYDAEHRAAKGNLPPLPIRFADFAAWQRATVSGPELDTHLAYWRTHLAGAESALELPLDRPRPATPGFAGAKQTVILPAELLQSLQRLAKAHDVTLYMVLLAAFQTLLHRYSGQEDIVVATVVAGRDYSALEPIVGYFANTLALRTSLDGDPTVAELLGRVRAVQLGASEHSAVPFEMLTSGTDGAPPLATPSVMFVFQNNAPASLQLGDATLRAAGVDAGTAKFDLFLSMGETSAGLRAALQYRTELFDDETMSRMLGHLHTLLSGMASDWSTQVSALPLLTAPERHQLLVEWNRTTADYSRTATLSTLVAAQAAATPERVAITDGEHTLTYAELTRCSTQLARALRARGVGPGMFVGVCMERSADMIVALLAVLHAGAAYVPLDPDYPEERLAFMLEDTRAAIVLTTSSVVGALPALPLLAMANGGQGILRLDPGWDKVETPPPFELATTDCASTNLAYVIYTSGSTGRPKGVMIEHRSAVAFVTWAQSVFGADELAGVLASTSICFDLSIFEIFVPLATGGTVIVVANALAAAGLTPKVPVTLINTVPSAITELLRIEGIPSSVRTVNLAGEPLAQRVVDALYDVPNVERVFDLYGPSEDTTYSTFTLRTAGGRATIGRPVANTQLYVLDPKQQLVPVGVPGELFIAGDKLARGYLNRPALTAERFVQNPFDSDPASRAYRTGDLVRYLRDGRLEYLGRLDNQVKLRGFRIELGEVETMLESDPAVAKAVAVVRELAPGDSRLIAYVVAVPGVELNLSRVRTAARRALPQYMLPSAIVPLDAFPLTRNGKIDRKALPIPEIVESVATVYVAPRTPTEEGVAAAWRDVLRRERVGVHDNFFELGGHSLIAMRIMSRMQESFGVRLPLNAVLEWPTVEQLAAKIDERMASGTSEVAEVAITRATRVATRRPAAPVSGVASGEGGS